MTALINNKVVKVEVEEIQPLSKLFDRFTDVNSADNKTIAKCFYFKLTVTSKQWREEDISHARLR